MEKKLKFMFLILSSISLQTIMSNADTQSSDHRSPCLAGKEKLTTLRFYVQDFVGGDSPTVWEIAKTNLTDVLPSAFGLVSVLDNLVTSEPEVDSKEVGRIQGIIGLTDFHEKALVMLLNLVFTEGEYKGSTLSVLGRNPLAEETREVPIVGGTGAFRMARGYAVTTTYSNDEAHHHGVIQYDVVVYHFDGLLTLLSQ
ncbi:PREDICTED: dirigent protein 1-like isoform X1 [Erythranthe guttata]|uniref:dirigent protein 1-like isoform X1 n=1 Tax=Erythranthe guttata TaxID=4155 RepID=UPI00064D930A|nr:PREDICTED: dirigent protein 1-like isoform X1 [Erythranthe guttata]|eukprot:XP_012833747.1 PREDICTED: dirigent protein 1-like isoform X1 [Erythranthe guttata]